MPSSGKTKLQTGDVFGNLVLVEFIGSQPGNFSRWTAKCNCGKVFTVTAGNLTRKPENRATRSCGDRAIHPRPNTKHGLCKTREYRAWKSMNNRCRPGGKEGSKKRIYYVDRGITVCDEWKHDFVAFLKHIGPMPAGHRIGVDRIRNDGNYEPGNVQWAGPKVQCNNRRSMWRVRFRVEPEIP